MMLKRTWQPLTMVTAGAALVLVASGCAPSGTAGASEGDTIKIGVLSTTEGTLAFGMDEAKAAIGISMEARGGTAEGGEIGGAQVEFVYEGTDGTATSAQTKAKKLVEQDGVDIVFGPLSGDEGEAIVQYALTTPELTFVNGTASPVSLTLEGAENFYRFNGDAAMWMGGLGNYAYDEKGYNTIYSIAEDYSFPYDNAGGFFTEYCAAGGEVTGNAWVPVGTTDYATIISQIPADTDAIYVGLGGSDAASFLSQAVTAGLDKPIVGGSIALDATALSGEANIADAATGAITGGQFPGADYDNPLWIDFSDAYKKQPNTFPEPSIFASAFYNSFESLARGLEESDGDLSDGQAALRDALSNLEWDSPTGHISVDDNNQAIITNFLVEVVNTDGELSMSNIAVEEGVKQGETVFDRFEGCPK